MTAPLAILGMNQDLLVVLFLGFILFVVFGRRLPETMRSLGKGIMEFKKGMKGLEDEDHFAGGPAAAPQQQPQPLPEAPRPPQRITQAAPKFDEPANPQGPPQV